MMVKTLLAPVLAIALMVGLTVEKHSWPEPEDVEEYHAEVAEEIRAMPEQVGEWESSEVELPMAAVALLRPNEILSRRYRHRNTGRTFQFIIIHCRDARDMVGHYPPNCYPAAGWQMRDRNDGNWSPDALAGMDVEGVNYQFQQFLPGASSHLYVTNLLILPDGSFGRTMQDVNRIATNRQFRVYGAAQVQFVFTGIDSQSERDEIIAQFVAAARPAVQAIRTGVQ